MGGFTINTEGFKELEAKLTELGEETAINVIRDGLREGGEVIADAIRSRAPVRPSLPSGTALPEGALSRDIGVYIGQEDGLESAIVRPGSETAYAANWVEYGHQQVVGGSAKKNSFYTSPNSKRRRRGKMIGNVPAYPFIRPGFEASVSEAVAVAEQSIARGIEKSAETEDR